MLITIIIFIVLLSILVLIHEGGHFAASKAAGIAVEEFGFGLPPRIAGKKIGQTLYSINWLPFGGFVKLKGEDPTDPQSRAVDSFYHKSLPARTGVILAGVLANFFLGVVLFYAVLWPTGFKAELPLMVDHQFRWLEQSTEVMIVAVEEESPAAAAGLAAGEIILAVDREKVTSAASLRQLIEEREGKPTLIQLRSPNGEIREIEAVPRAAETARLGIGLAEIAILSYESLPQKIFSGFAHSINTIEFSAKIFGQLAGQAVSQGTVRPIAQGVAGPVGIAQLTSQIVSLGILPTLSFAALLSLNLAVINVLPFPALDGGRLAFLGMEAVLRRKLNPKIEKWVNSAGFAVLLALILLITFNDITRIFR